MQFQHGRRHAKRPGVALGSGAVAAIQHQLHQIGGVFEQYAAIARQGRVGHLPRGGVHAFALFAMALHALAFVNLGPLGGHLGRNLCVAAGQLGCIGRRLGGALCLRLEVNRHGLKVSFFQVLEAVLHHFSHRAIGLRRGR